MAEKCFLYGYIFAVFVTALCVFQSCKPGEQAFINRLEICQYQVHLPTNITPSEPIIEQEKYAESNLQASLTNPYLTKLKNASVHSQPEKSFVKLTAARRTPVSKTPDKPKDEELAVVAPWHTFGILLIVLSIVSCLGLLLTPTFYVVSMGIIFAAFIFFNIKYNGRLRKLSTVLSVIILQIPGIFYVCGFFNLLAFSYFPLYTMLLALPVGLFLVAYLLLKIIFEIEKYTDAENRHQINQKARSSVLKMAYIFFGLALLFSIILLFFINPFAIGFIPFTIGATILINAIIGLIFLMYNFYMTRGYLKTQQNG